MKVIKEDNPYIFHFRGDLVYPKNHYYHKLILTLACNEVEFDSKEEEQKYFGNYDTSHIKETDTTSIFVFGESKCSPEDQFVKKVGREKASGRLKSKLTKLFSDSKYPKIGLVCDSTSLNSCKEACIAYINFKYNIPVEKIFGEA